MYCSRGNFMATAYDYIEYNKLKSRWLVALFPISFTLFAYLSVLFFFILIGLFVYFQPSNILSFYSMWQHAFLSAHEMCKWVLPICFLLAIFWAWQAWKQGDQIVLESLPHLRELNKWDEPDVYNLLENLCISTGDYLPRLYILEDDSMNAFAVGMNPMQAGIVVSRGLITKLDRAQLEGVLAHELAHIRHYDTRLMVIILTCVAFFTFAGEMFFYGTEKDNIESDWDEKMAPLRQARIPLFVYIGLMLMCYGYIVAPVLRFALSRTRESLADAQAALMTRYPRGLASALWCISQDSEIEVLEGRPLLGVMCIARPIKKQSFFEKISGIGKTHPPVEERIFALRKMDGGEGLFQAEK